MNAADFRRVALGLPDVAEGEHVGQADFRVGGRILATLAAEAQGFGNLMLTPEVQAEFLADAPELFLPVAGGWGRGGATHLRLAVATEETLQGALQAAWKLRVQKNEAAARKRRKTAGA